MSSWGRTWWDKLRRRFSELDRRLASNALRDFEAVVGNVPHPGGEQVLAGDVTMVQHRLVVDPTGHPRFVLEHHWATWCEPCVEEMPRLTEAVAEWKAHGRHVRLVLISWDLVEGGRVDDVAAEVAMWMHEHGATHREHTLLYTGTVPELVSALQLPIDKIPQTALRDPNGHVIRRWAHPMSDADLAEAGRLVVPERNAPKLTRPTKPASRRAR